jgi:3',5'-cyclic AMP phosphodiesterase CpdA
VSDLHVARRPGGGEWNAKRLLASVNQRFFRGRRHREERAAAALSSLAAGLPDLVLFTGDFTQHGLESELAVAEKLLYPLTERKIPVLAVAGNHEYYGGARPSSLTDRLLRLSLGIRPDPDGIIRSFPGVEIILLEQSVPTWLFFSKGRQDPGELERAAAVWSLPPLGIMRLACGHFPVIDIGKGAFLALRGLEEAGRLAGFLARCRVAGYFCGHNHRRFETELLGGCRQYSAPAIAGDGAEAALYECGGELAYPALVAKKEH